MVKRGFFVLGLFVILMVGVFFEQRFIDLSCETLKTQTQILTQCIESENLEQSKQKCDELKKLWEEKEVVLSLLVDFKDIEKIGSQLTLVSAHLDNQDFDLAFVESKVLFHALKVFGSTVSFDPQNII